MGRAELPIGRRPRDRRRGDGRRLRGDQAQSRRPRRRGLHGEFLPQCRYCEAGLEQYCKRGATFTYNSIDKDGTPTYGGYSQAIVVDENFVLRIPDALPLDKAAPLLCAGITLFSPLRHWKAGPDTRLAIIGLGGLGHMGVKLGAAMGIKVSVLSQSLKKMEDGLRLGASEYYATADRDTFKKLRNSFDLILNTVSVNLPMLATT